MSKKKSESITFITPFGILRYPKVPQPDTKGKYADGKFKTDIVFSDDDFAVVEKAYGKRPRSCCPTPRARDYRCSPNGKRAKASVSNVSTDLLCSTRRTKSCQTWCSSAAAQPHASLRRSLRTRWVATPASASASAKSRLRNWSSIRVAMLLRSTRRKGSRTLCQTMATSNRL
jgi:hypothetical protein